MDILCESVLVKIIVDRKLPLQYYSLCPRRPDWKSAI